MDGESIGGYMARVDAQRFVGRVEEGRRIERLLEVDSRDRVLYIHGEPGIGKSTLLRHAGRLAAGAGWQVLAFDGGELLDGIGALDAVADIEPGTSCLVTIDRFERLGARTSDVREYLCTTVTAPSRIVLASRRAPDAGWRRDGWEHVVDVLALAPLDDEAARALLRARGLIDVHAVDATVAWAGGLPLALAARCETAPDQESDDTTALPSLGRLLLDRVVVDEISGHDTNAILVAAIAPTVDTAMLRTVLRDRRSASTMQWLRGLSFVDTVADRARLHERLAVALVTELRATDPVRERQLRLAVADHLHDRAVLGEPALLGELRLLVVDDDVRWGLGESDRDIVYPDVVRPGDVETLRSMLAAALGDDWARLQRWIEQGAEHVVVVRDRTGALVGCGVWATTETFPAWASDDAKLMPIVSWAHDHGDGSEGLILLDVFDFLGAADGVVAPVISVGNTAVMMRSGLANPRWIHAEAPANDQATTFMKSLGYRDAMEARLGTRTVRWMVVDHGVGGVVGATRTLVYRSCGVQPSSSDVLVHVRNALRSAHDPHALAANPLAERIDPSCPGGLRGYLLTAADDAFGDSERELTMRRCLRLGYLDDGSSHGSAQRALHLSRSTYFRWLAEATSRLSRFVTGDLDR